MAQHKADFVKLVRTVSGSANDNGTAETQRVLNGLELLKRHDVTLELLAETEAGRKLKKLSKHKHTEIAAAASGVVQCWKKKLKGRVGEGDKAHGLEITKPDSTGLVEQFSVPLESPVGAPGELKKVGEPFRDKVRSGLADALKVEFERCGGDPNLCAVEIEVAAFRQNSGVTPQYKSKCRSLIFNLKDKKNTGLRRRVLMGELSGDVLVTLSSEELANEEKQQEMHNIKQKKLQECERGQTAAATTDQFTCGRCKQNKCIYYQMQTRSADEPMTTFVTCTNCNNRWKF